MINDIFKLFGEKAADILFEIITECMDDYLYIFDLQNNTFEISQSAVKRFNMSKNVLTDAANEVMKVVYEEDRRMLAKHLAVFLIYYLHNFICSICQNIFRHIKPFHS